VRPPPQLVAGFLRTLGTIGVTQALLTERLPGRSRPGTAPCSNRCGALRGWVPVHVGLSRKRRRRGGFRSLRTRCSRSSSPLRAGRMRATWARVSGCERVGDRAATSRCHCFLAARTTRQHRTTVRDAGQGALRGPCVVGPGLHPCYKIPPRGMPWPGCGRLGGRGPMARENALAGPADLTLVGLGMATVLPFNEGVHTLGPCASSWCRP
jgi:hypothetical protein